MKKIIRENWKKIIRVYFSISRQIFLISKSRLFKKNYITNIFGKSSYGPSRSPRARGESQHALKKTASVIRKLVPGFHRVLVEAAPYRYRAVRAHMHIVKPPKSRR